MRRAAALLLSALLAVTLCACGGEPVSVTGTPEPGPTETPAPPQRFSLGYDPTASLHPIRGDSRVNLALTSLVYEGLYELDEQFEPQPLLAAGAQVDESGRVWTVTVVEGVRFSDGTPLTAGHVAASLEAARSSDLYSARLRQVSSVRAADNAVVITLSAPNGALPALLDIPVVLETGEDAPLGTGRYRYAGEGDSLCLIANYNHGGTLPYETIGLYPVTAPDQRISAFDSGNVTAVLTDFTSGYQLGYSCSYEAWDYATTGMLYVGFRASGGPCSSPLVRRAFSGAFDREQLVTVQLAGHGDGAALPISPVHQDYSREAAAALSFDRETAAELLEEAGYRLKEDGLRYQGYVPLTVTLLVNGDNTAKAAMADLLAEELAALGVTVTVSKQSWANYLAALRDGRFDLYLGEVYLTGDFDPTDLLSGGLNYGGYVSEPLAQALAEWKGAGGELRNRAAEQLWTLFAQEAPFAPLAFKRESLLVRWGAVSGLSPTRGDPFYGMEHWQLGA